MARLILRLTDGLMTPNVVCWILMVWFTFLWPGGSRDGLVAFEIVWRIQQWSNGSKMVGCVDTEKVWWILRWSG